MSSLRTETTTLSQHPAGPSSSSGMLPRPECDRSASTSESSEAWRYARPTASKPGYDFTPYQLEQLRKIGPEPAGNSVSLLPQAISAVNYCRIEGFLQSLLPSVAHIWRLVDYHEQYLLWYHCCYHGPTFRSELQSLIRVQNGQEVLDVANLDLQWLALLFSIMTGSLTCTVEARIQDWGFSQLEVASLSTQWYKAVIACLDHGEWTVQHDRRSVQAVATLTMSAHALGSSGELAVLLASAVKIAQNIALDRLEYDGEVEHVYGSSSAEQRHHALQRDLGRKLWSQLCVQDWMSAPSARNYMINPLHFTTTRPSSRDYLTMEFIPETFPTYISYGNYLFDIAKLVVLHHDATLQSITPFTKYQQVLEYDKRMRILATKEMPRYFHVVEPIDSLWPEWVHWARSSLTVSFSHKIIMIHRDFIKASFSDPAYTTTRVTCVAAAKTILSEASKAKSMNGPIIWIDKAFCILAALVLCLDIRHRVESEPELARHESLVRECIEQLSLFKSSAIAVQGVKVLSESLANSSRPSNHTRSVIQNIEGFEMGSSTLISNESPARVERGERRTVEIFPPQSGLSSKALLELFSLR
ncbi:hypothetical protein M409DRAFT_20718 [Zasmidium cellare ATCC 36951]|uniref:Transcription factor domain-containing protein n=1 Tax=Zasmidium cellare ATCC 36951 TaxID=1080233 RepID=A0A6A6CNT0_ZASCE|nr:uncharacterized protein M409DRAFT_20718 [Zasmidium cellare ATCC 36951]KAF2168701.1 hypothetical protein M409DRAFT_20718 [Zasmidium cellare ATCC 36951]